MRASFIPSLLSLLPFAAAVPARKTVTGFHTITTTGSASGTALPASVLAGTAEGSTDGTLEDADASYGVTTVTMSEIETVVVVVPGVTTFSAAPKAGTTSIVTDEVLVEAVVVEDYISSSWVPSTSMATYTYEIEVEEVTTAITTTRLL